jgi:hypothetical protein
MHVCTPTARDSRARVQAPKQHSLLIQTHPQARERRIRRKRVLRVQLGGGVAVAVGRARAAAAARRVHAAAGRAPLAKRAGAPALARLPRLKVLRVLREGGARSATHEACSLHSPHPRCVQQAATHELSQLQGPAPCTAAASPPISANSSATSAPVARLCPMTQWQARALASERPACAAHAQAALDPAQAFTGALAYRQEYSGGALP